jgi:hypothetical protein
MANRDRPKAAKALPPSGGSKPKTRPALSESGLAEATLKKQRLGEALRENLRRRKAQLTARLDGDVKARRRS